MARDIGSARSRPPRERRAAGSDNERASRSEYVAAVLARAQESGLISGKGGRIAARVAPELIERAKSRTGLRTDSELVEFALANVAVEDGFAFFRKLKGTVDPDLDLGF